MAEEKDRPELVREQSRIVIQFTFVGSADFQFIPENISPLQMLAAGQWLVARASKMVELQMVAEMQAQAQQQIAVARFNEERLKVRQ